MALFDNLFGTPPEYLTGLLGEEDLSKLQNKANTTGLINTALAFIAQPRNQRYGSALPYLGKALMAGQQSGQGVYENALKGFETQQKLAELKRLQEQRTAQEDYINTLPENVRATVKANPTLLAEYAKTSIIPKERKYEKVGDQLIDVTATPTVAYTAPQQPAFKIGQTRDFRRGNEIITQEFQPDGTWKEISTGSAFAPPQAAANVNVNLPPAEKTILEVDKDTLSGLTSNANAARSIATQTKTINSLIGNQQGSGVVKLSSDLQNYLGIKSPEANVNQAVSALANKAATEIRTPGSGSTSDLEFNAYRAAFPSLATSQPGRALMGQIAEANAKRMSKLADWARVQVQKGTFSYEGLAAYDDSLGSAVSDSIKKQVESLTGGKPATGFSIRRKQ